ncbi:MAG: MspA family porin, partial [Mycobacteriaceae bacterium]
MSFFTRFAITSSVSVAALLGVAGVSGVSGAVPIDVAPVDNSTVTSDGWVLTTSIESEVVNSVPPLNVGLFSREGFVTARTHGWVSGQGVVPLTSGLLESGYQIACNTDFSG